VKAAGHERCTASTGICEHITIGHGKLDDLGYWQHGCWTCAREAEKGSRGESYWPGCACWKLTLIMHITKFVMGDRHPVTIYYGPWIEFDKRQFMTVSITCVESWCRQMGYKLDYVAGAAAPE
jgi:hypothetical protein